MTINYEVALRVELPAGVDAQIADKLAGHVGSDVSDWLLNEAQKAVQAVLLAKLQEPGIQVAGFQSSRMYELEVREIPAEAIAEPGMYWAEVPALGPIAVGKVRRLFERGAVESEVSA